MASAPLGEDACVLVGGILRLRVEPQRVGADLDVECSYNWPDYASAVSAHVDSTAGQANHLGYGATAGSVLADGAACQPQHVCSRRQREVVVPEKFISEPRRSVLTAG